MSSRQTWDMGSKELPLHRGLLREYFDAVTCLVLITLNCLLVSVPFWLHVMCTTFKHRRHDLWTEDGLLWQGTWWWGCCATWQTYEITAGDSKCVIIPKTCHNIFGIIIHCEHIIFFVAFIASGGYTFNYRGLMCVSPNSSPSLILWLQSWRMIPCGSPCLLPKLFKYNIGSFLVVIGGG